MNRLLRFTLLALLVGCSQNVPTPEPSTAPDFSPPASMSTELADAAVDVAVTPNGDVLVVGFTAGDIGEVNDRKDVDFWFLRRYSAEGKLAWEQRVDRCEDPPFVPNVEPDPGSPPECADSSVAVASDDVGNAYALSQTNTGEGDVITTYLSKYTVDGTRLWDEQVAEYHDDDQGGLGQLANDFAVATDGNAYLIARRGGPCSKVGQDAALLKYDTNGQKLWEKPGGFSDTEKVAVSGDSVYTAGVKKLCSYEDNPEGAVSKLRKLTTDSETLWEKIIPNSHDDFSVSLAVSGEARVYVVTGIDKADRIYDDGTATITKFDGEGNLLWNKTLEPEPYWALSETAVDARGRLYVVGTVETEKRLTYGYALRYSPEGEQDWFSPLKAPGERGVLDSITYPLGIATTMTTDSYGNPQTRLYLAGYSATSGGSYSDAFLVAANDRSDEEDQGGGYPSDLEAYWVKN